jgi:hypothetical protein
MHVVVMPQQNSKPLGAMIPMDARVVHQISVQVLLAVDSLIRFKQDSLVQEVIAQRSTRTKWWQRAFRGSLDPVQVRRELSNASVVSDDRWFLCSLGLNHIKHAAASLVRITQGQIGHVEIPHQEWVTVLRTHNKIRRGSLLGHQLPARMKPPTKS